MDPTLPIPEPLGRADDAGDVHTVESGGRTFVLVGTAHVSAESVDLARRVIERERPDGVCIELDPQRYDALARRERFESLDLKQVIRSQQLATLLVNLLLAAYQRRLGFHLGVQPGAELLEAARTAEAAGIPVHLCDRDVRVTLRRAWKALSLWHRLQLATALLASLFDRTEITEADLRELRSEDVLSRLMRELGEAFPGLKRVLIDERDAYLAERIRQSPGRRLVAVVGAGHVEGIRRALEADATPPPDLAALERVPPVSGAWRLVGWGVPLVVLGALAAIGVRHGAGAAAESLLFWVLANGIPSSVGAVIAWAHPVTIVSAFVAAPITSLTPVIGAGYVTAFVQAWLRPPFVRELGRVMEDVVSMRGWWGNRLLRIFLVFVLTTLGSLLGTAVGGAEILSNLVGTGR